MASLYDIKPRFQAALRPYADQLAAHGITANQVTLGAVALSALIGLMLWLFPGAILPLLLMPVALFARMALNAIDGMLAREHGQQSRLGALLNEIGDMASDAALYFPLALLPNASGGLVVIAASLGLIAEGTGLAALLVGSPRRTEGPMGKSDRALAFGAIALLSGVGLGPGWFINLLLLAVIALAAFTIYNRAARALAANPGAPAP